MIIIEESGQKYVCLAAAKAPTENRFVAKITLDGIIYDDICFLGRQMSENKYELLFETISIAEDNDFNSLAFRKKALVNQLCKRQIPATYQGEFAAQNTYEEGNPLWHNAGYVMLADDWLRALAAWIGERKVLEVCGGLGALAHCLKERGVDIISSDDGSYKAWKEEDRWLEMVTGDAVEVIGKYGKQADLILLAHPPHGSVDLEILEAMREINPELQLLYLGKYDEGNTADDFVTEAIVCDNDGLDAVRSLYRDWISYSGVQTKIKLIL